MKMRLWIKHLICLLGFGSTLIEYCHDCGIRQPVYWWCDNSLWSQITGEQPVVGDNMSGILCPACFDQRANVLGLLLKWTPTVEENIKRNLEKKNESRSW